MKKTAVGLICLLCLVLSACSQKPASQAKQQASASTRHHDKASEPEIKAATPEDPGPVATVVSPLAAIRTASKEGPEESQETDGAARPPGDHVVLVATAKPQNFLRGVFAVADYSQFSFLIPPHQVSPKLQGNFRSFSNRASPDSSSAKVEVMLLNEQEFDDFQHHRIGSATYESESSSQRMDYAMPATYDGTRQYHLVFQNPTGRKEIFVKADFTITFE